MAVTLHDHITSPVVFGNMYLISKPSDLSPETIYSFHAQSAHPSAAPPQSPPPATSPPFQPRSLLIKTRPPRPSKLRPPFTGYSTYRIHMINRYISLNCCRILSLSETGFIVSAHRLTNITLLTYILDTRTVIRAIGVSPTALKTMSFYKIFDLTAGVYFHLL